VFIKREKMKLMSNMNNLESNNLGLSHNH